MTFKALLVAALLVILFISGCQSPATPTDLLPSDKAGPASSSPTPYEVQNIPPATKLTTEQSTPTATAIVDETPTISDSNATEEGSVPTRRADADVEFVRAVQATDGRWTFHVTVRHPDAGWEDYANGWDVVTLDGQVLRVDAGDQFTRLLLHPHENEQPFTRSQSGLIIPDSITQVEVRAHDLVDGYGGKIVVVDLTASSGPGFEVERQ